MTAKSPLLPIVVLTAVVLWTGILLLSALTAAKDDAAAMGTLGHQRIL